jgi:N-acetylglucosaminyl-diphospho-decaprenol L-rhamnosyltransferase
LKLLIVIVSYRVTELTIQCLRALESEMEALPEARVAVCENGTGPEAVRVLREAIETHGWSKWAYLRDVWPNRGFTGGNNVIIREALAWPEPPEYFLLLNADAFVRPGAVSELVRFMDAYPRVGVAGSRIENPDGTWQCSPYQYITWVSELDRGFKLGLLTRLLSHYTVTPPVPSAPAPAEWVSGASLIIRRQVFGQVGLLDEGLYTYFDDVDFCLNARRAGWDVWYVPGSRVSHLGGQSTGITQEPKQPKRQPAYWFLARRRYFLKNFGPLRAALADIAFLIGFASWRLRRRIQRKPDTDSPHMLWDALRHSVLCTGFKVKPVPNPAMQSPESHVARAVEAQSEESVLAG